LLGVPGQRACSIEEQILAEAPRGATPRYWEDVQVGDEIDTIIKGPMGLTDFVAFIAGGGAPIPRVSAHSVALKKYHKHPKWAFRDPKTHALEPVYSVHYNDYAAALQGAQIAYDVGIQRTSWGLHALTNWMGDAGTVKEIFGQYRAHVYLGDVVRLGGRVESKEVDADGNHVVRLTTWVLNQRGQNGMPGTAVVALPARDNTPRHELAAARITGRSVRRNPSSASRRPCEFSWRAGSRDSCAGCEMSDGLASGGRVVAAH
jgi:hypothetical protein